MSSQVANPEAVSQLHSSESHSSESHSSEPHSSRSSINQVLRLFGTEMRLFLRESQVLIFVFGFPVLTVLVLGGVFGNETGDSGFENINPQAFYIAAYFGVVLAAIGLIMLPAHVASYIESGVIRRFETAGFATWVFPLVQFMSGIAFAVLGFASLLATAYLTYGIPEILDWPRTLLGLGLGTLAFTSIGVALGVFMPSARAAQGLGLTMFFPMFLLSGGGPPPAALPDTMSTVANWLPLSHVTRAIQEPWLGLGDGQDHLLIVFAMLVVATGVWMIKSTRVSAAA